MSYFARSPLLRLRSQLGRFHRGAQPLRYFSGNNSHSDDYQDRHMYQGRPSSSRRGPYIVRRLPEYSGPKLLPPKLPTGVKRKLIQDRGGNPWLFVPEDAYIPDMTYISKHIASDEPIEVKKGSSFPHRLPKLNLENSFDTHRSFHTQIRSTPTTDESSELASIKNRDEQMEEETKATKGEQAEAPPPSSLYLQLGSAVARLLIKPINNPHHLELAYNVFGYLYASPGFIAHNDQLFIMGGTAKFKEGDDSGSGQSPFQLRLYQWTSDSQTVFAPSQSVKLSSVSPYMVRIGDNIHMFGGRDKYTPKAGWYWGCIFDCSTHSWTFLDPLPRMRHGCKTLSHIIWDGKVYLFCHPIFIIKEPSHDLGFVCSYDTKTNLLSYENILFQELQLVFHQPKIVVGDILLVFCLKEQIIRPFDLKTKRWIVVEERSSVEMESFSPIPPREYHDCMDFEEANHYKLFPVKSPYAAADDNELFLFWQVKLQSFYTSRIRVHVEKSRDGQTKVSVSVVEGCQEVNVHCGVFHYGNKVPGVVAM